MLEKVIVKAMIEELVDIGYMKTKADGMYVCGEKAIGRRVLLEKGKYGVHDIFKYVTVTNIEYKNDYMIVSYVVIETGWRQERDSRRYIVPYETVLQIMAV